MENYKKIKPFSYKMLLISAKLSKLPVFIFESARRKHEKRLYTLFQLSLNKSRKEIIITDKYEMKTVCIFAWTPPS